MFPYLMEMQRWTGVGHVARRSFPPEEVFYVVSRVEYYKEFVPWCIESVVIHEEPGYMEAKLQVGFRIYKEHYTSRVEMERNRHVLAIARDTPLFHHLRNEWFLEEGPQPGTTQVNFGIDFAFRSALYQHVTDLFFNEVVRHMVSAFEKRCAYVRKQRQELGRFPLEDSPQWAPPLPAATTSSAAATASASSTSVSATAAAAASSPSSAEVPSLSDQRLSAEQLEEEELEWEAAWDDVARRARRPPPLPSKGIWE